MTSGLFRAEPLTGAVLARCRALTALAMVAFPLGAALVVYGDGAEVRWIAAAGLALFGVSALSAAGYVGGAFRRILGETARGLDERELDQRRRAFAWAYQAFGGLALIFVIYLALANDFAWWRPGSFEAWNAVFWGAMLYWFSLPTAFLAWTTRPVGEEG